MAADGTLEVPAVVDTVLAEIAVKEGYRRPRFNVQPGSGARDGHTSVLFRATVRDEDAGGRQDELSLMVKTSMPVFGGLMRKMYAAEGRMYDLVLPAMQEIAGLTEPLPWPRCVHALIEVPPPQCLVLADLRPSGYAMARRREALDADHCRLALKSLARFHGAGLALQRLRPDAFRDMHAPLCSVADSPEMNALFQPFVDSLLQSPFADAVRDRFPEGSDVPAVLRRLFASFRKDICALMAHGEEAEGYTIIHNDCHINNLLFQYDSASGAVTHCKLIDFQTVNYGCPAVDLASLLLSGTERGVRAEHWDALLRGYHDELQATLRAAGIADPDDVYSWQLLQKQWRRVLPYGLGLACMLYTGFCGDDEKILEMRESMASVDYDFKEGEGKEKQKPKEVGILVNDYVLQRYADLVEDVARWGLLPTVTGIDGWVAERAARQRNGTPK